VEAEVSSPVPDLSHVPGVSNVQIEGERVRCQVTGPIGPLLSVLEPLGVRTLTSREPSLEELFLAHYGSSSDAASSHAA
jgi:ABC-2 type transport system ATP-binding protein